ncbi:hypothetical protein [Halococcus agarilyticus]|uniref:hypothetical protein n=1 Tax=Halococcus agarilyticus TaxID=1232219 RepID=UPI000677FD21|nr:hypothetical protein [Halococcus agarilyticus]
MDTIVYENEDGEVVETEVEMLQFSETRQSWYWEVERDEEEETVTRKSVPRNRVVEVVEERGIRSGSDRSGATVI